MFIYLIVYQLYPMTLFSWPPVKNSTILSIDYMQCAYTSCFIEFLIIVEMALQMGCLKLTELYDND